MIGAGVFVVFGPAARAAGTGLLAGLVIAAMIAYCNATASAQLAACSPTSGGTYIYGRERLGSWLGFTAGWGFLTGKTASCAAMALTFATYAVAGPWWAQRLVAVAGVLGLTALNYRGVTKTAIAARVLVGATLAVLVVVVAGIAVAGGLRVDYLSGLVTNSRGGLYGTLQAAGLLFFAFAGYARIATIGEEVRDPERTIPRAIPIALIITLVIYFVVGMAALLTTGPDRLANAAAPLTEAVNVAGAGSLAPVVRVGAAVASLGALLSLIAGVGRTSLAMARHHDLPSWLAAVHPRFRVPHHAEAALAVLVSALVLMADLRGVIGFSSVGVLVYYAIANAAALTQPADQRRWPRALHILGIGGCAALIGALPTTGLLAGLAVFTVGLAGRQLTAARPNKASRSRFGCPRRRKISP
ncbi:MAG: APC family permease [Pseudonocardiales bacterium]|nr:APC family permease [Pseudonocardiales bacterium]